MTRYLAALTLLLMMGMVLTRVFIMKSKGVDAMHFGRIDKTDYFIPPFALFYFYLVFAAAGIDTERPDELITTGIFAFTRNPIYVGFAFILLGQFLIHSSWLLLAYLVAGYWLFHRQVLLEEEFLSRHYGEDFENYRRRVRRYL